MMHIIRFECTYLHNLIKSFLMVKITNFIGLNKIIYEGFKYL